MSKPKAPGFFQDRKMAKTNFCRPPARCQGSQAAASGNFRLKINATIIATAPMKYGLDMPRY